MAFIGLHRPPEQALKDLPAIGDDVSERIGLLLGATNKQQAWAHDSTLLVLFLRHTGCPFAEAAVRRALLQFSSDANVCVMIVTHGAASVAQQWFAKIVPGTPSFIHVHDPDRRCYGEWGVGYGGWRALLHPAMAGQWLRLFSQGIVNRRASGTRWQQQAAFLVSPEGQVLWRHLAQHAGDLPDLREIARA